MLLSRSAPFAVACCFDPIMVLLQQCKTILRLPSVWWGRQYLLPPNVNHNLAISRRNAMSALRPTAYPVTAPSSTAILNHSITVVGLTFRSPITPNTCIPAFTRMFFCQNQKVPKFSNRSNWKTFLQQTSRSAWVTPLLRARVRAFLRFDRLASSRDTAANVVAKENVLKKRGRDITNRFVLRNVKLAERRRTLASYRSKLVEQSKNAGHGLATLWKKYGHVGLVTYFSIYLGALWGFYIAISQGLFTGNDLKNFLEKNHLDKYVSAEHIEKLDSREGKLLVAWIACKIVEPVRALLALGLTPPIARFCWWLGILKKP